MKSTVTTAKPHHNPAKRPQDWRPEERLLALQESHGLIGEALNAWCRQRGLFAHQLAQWKSDFCQVTNPRSGGDGGQTLRTLKIENQRLERGLNRKDKALAEAAYFRAKLPPNPDESCHSFHFKAAASIHCL